MTLAEPAPSIPDRIQNHYAELNDTEQRIADYLITHLKELTFASASQVARSLEISTSTVVRFAQKIGLEGYSELQQHLHRAFLKSLELTELNPNQDNLLEDIVAQESANLQLLTQQRCALERAARRAAGAHRVWVTGGRSSTFVAAIMNHFLRLLRDGVELLGYAPGDLPDRLLDVGEGDVVLVIAMSRYNQETVKVARLACERAPVVLFIDEFSSPLLPYGSETIHFATRTASTFRSLTAAVATAQAFVMETAVYLPEARQRIAEAEYLWEAFNVFSNEQTTSIPSSIKQPE